MIAALLMAIAQLDAVSRPVEAGIAHELSRLGVATALVLPSSAIDEFPIWSPDSRYVAADVMGTWKKVDLRTIALVSGKWHDQPIGVADRKAPITELDPETAKRWRPSTEPSPDVAEVRGVRIEFRRSELRTSLVVVRRGRKPEVIWTSSLETCGAPAIAPDGTLVAFICETNGLLVMALK